MHTGRDFQVLARDFSIPITYDEYCAIEHSERNPDEYVSRMINDIPDGYDCNAHFGLYVFVSVEKEFDNDKTLHAISEVINREGKWEWIPEGDDDA